MCRNIHLLYNFEPPASEAEIHEAALQYVRKVSGFRRASQANTAAFDLAVDQISAATSRLLDSLATNAPPRSREVEAARSHARSVKRFGKGLAS